MGALVRNLEILFMPVKFCPQEAKKAPAHSIRGAPGLFSFSPGHRAGTALRHQERMYHTAAPLTSREATHLSARVSTHASEFLG